jgi:glyoxylase-like metal-dependent hydrolase (beta-lactamase superfamily II)
MTHLHFDHCGGSVQWNKEKTGYEPAFQKTPNLSMKATGNGQQTQSERRLLMENILPMQESGQLNF